MNFTINIVNRKQGQRYRRYTQIDPICKRIK